MSFINGINLLIYYLFVYVYLVHILIHSSINASSSFFMQAFNAVEGKLVSESTQAAAAVCRTQGGKGGVKGARAALVALLSGGGGGGDKGANAQEKEKAAAQVCLLIYAFRSLDNHDLPSSPPPFLPSHPSLYPSLAHRPGAHISSAPSASRASPSLR